MHADLKNEIESKIFLDLRFVDSAFAVQPMGSVDGKAQPVSFLIEEEICKDSHGRFIKYINNSQAVLLPKLRENERCIGEYLLFAQHVMWMRSKKLLFVTDFQGERCFEVLTHTLSSCTEVEIFI